MWDLASLTAEAGRPQVHDAGDHEIVVGAVRELAVEREVGPLVFYRGGYANLD